MIAPETEKYAHPDYPQNEDVYGFYLPDAVVEPFLTAREPVVKEGLGRHLSLGTLLPDINQHHIAIDDVRLSFEESAALVVDAFAAFDPQLGEKAKAVFTTPERWHISKDLSRHAGGCCHPARCETNENPYAIIEYNCDETINDPIYLAHELGHLIVDDRLNEAGFYCEDSPSHMDEIQAYFTQHIMYDHLSRHSAEKLRGAGETHFIAEVTRNMYQLPIASALLIAEKTGTDEERLKAAYETELETHLGERWKEFVYTDMPLGLDEHAKEGRLHSMRALHSHAMASVIARGLFDRASTLDAEQRGAFLDDLYCGNGPKNIADILDQYEIGALDQWAQDTMQNIFTPLEEFAERAHNPPSPNASDKALPPGRMNP